MVAPPVFDSALWFEIPSRCSGRHYLLGNPHTFSGRMSAWCPAKARVFTVSKHEIGDCSEHARRWIAGYLAGNQPAPPLSETGEVLPPDAPAMRRWFDAVDLFVETGFWSDRARACAACGAGLLPSAPGPRCAACTTSEG